MSEKKATTNPVQLPILIMQEPGANQYSLRRIEIPIRWEDFTPAGVKALAIAGENIIEAVIEENRKRYDAKAAIKQVDAPARAKPAESFKPASVPSKTAADEAIQAFILDNPNAILAKRQEFGIDIITDATAAMILMRELGVTHAEPAEIPADYQPPKAPKFKCQSMVYFEGEFGFSLYAGSPDSPVKEDLSALEKWLKSIPIEIRHRNKTDYPKVGKNGKYLMLNKYELGFVLDAAGAQNIATEKGVSK